MIRRIVLSAVGAVALAACGLGAGAEGDESLGASESNLLDCGDLRCDIPTNERFAIQTMRDIHQAMLTQQTDFISQPPPYVTVIIRNGDGSISNRFAGAVRNGYSFNVTIETPDAGPFQWSSTAEPIVYKRTGIRSFYIDETGILLGGDVGNSDGGISQMPEI